MAKADVKMAFCLLPINPLCFNSLGFFFNGKTNNKNYRVSQKLTKTKKTKKLKLQS